MIISKKAQSYRDFNHNGYCYMALMLALQAWEQKSEGKVLKLGTQILTPKYWWWYIVGIYLINQLVILRGNLTLILASLCSHRVIVKHYKKLMTHCLLKFTENKALLKKSFVTRSKNRLRSIASYNATHVLATH